MKQIVRLCMPVVWSCASFHPTLAQNLAAQKNTVTTPTPCFEADGDRMGYPSGAPFTGSWKYTVARKRPDGTTLNTASPEKALARDSSGRTYFESSIGATNGVISFGRTAFAVNDPVEHIWLSWLAGRNVVSLRHYPNPDTSEVEERTLKAPWLKDPWAEPFCLAWDPEGGKYEGGDYKVEKLGTKTILGIAAEGILATRVFPAGYKGFIQPVTVTEERWYSIDLQLALLSIVDDPRIGRGTYELTTLERSEPSATLFRAPQGYTIEEMNPRTADQNSATGTKVPGR